MTEPESLQPIRRITRIGVRKLFGLYDHDIQLNQKERITILHGPNGVGKTVFLEMVRDFLTGILSRFRSVPFEEFYVEYEDGDSSSLKPFKPPKQVNYTGTLDFFKSKSAKEPLRLDSNRALKIDEGSVFFVEVDRMQAKRKKMGSHQVETIPRVAACSDHMKQQMGKVLARYAQKSQKLDQSFPQRLIGSKSVQSVASLKKGFIALSEQRNKYRHLGLLDKEQGDSAPFDISELDALEDSKRSVMTLYLEDSQAKLETLTPFAKKIELLLSTINSRLVNKSLSIDLESGILANSIYSNLELSSLSSGEQHLLIVIYELLFKVDSNTMVLIDEPELSWHISWQKNFIEDLKAISNLVGFDALVATHSPYIVEGHSDLMVPLSSEPVTQQEAA